MRGSNLYTADNCRRGINYINGLGFSSRRASRPSMRPFQPSSMMMPMVWSNWLRVSVIVKIAR
jgi:hypothetical protein